EERKKFVLDDRPADTAAEFIELELRPPHAYGVVAPGIGVQVVVAMIPEDLTMKLVGPATRGEIGLHRGHAEALVHVELVGLDRHLLDVLQPDLNSRGRVAAKFHATRAAHDSVDIVSLGDRR